MFSKMKRIGIVWSNSYKKGPGPLFFLKKI